MKQDHGKFLKRLYFYFFSAVGLILVIIGIFQLSDYAVRKYLLPNYYLGYEENRCDYLTQPIPEKTPSEATPEAQKKITENCEKKLEEFRKYKEVTDLARSISFVVVGSLVFAFHFKQTRRE